MRFVSHNAHLRCSFCNKAQGDVRKLIAGPKVFICDECVQVCGEIIQADEPLATADQMPSPSHKTPPAQAVECSLCGLPFTSEDALIVSGRAFLCPGCVAEIEATLAERRGDVD